MVVEYSTLLSGPVYVGWKGFPHCDVFGRVLFVIVADVPDVNLFVFPKYTYFCVLNSCSFCPHR